MDETCVLCTGGHSESIEHILFQCPFFKEHRELLLQDLIALCRSQPSLCSLSRSTITPVLLNPLLSPPTDCQRNFSAGQLPLTLFHWLSANLPSSATTLRLGKSIHQCLIGSYQTFWRARCDAIKERHLLFKDRLGAFPTPKPLHEMLEEDFIIYALNWHALHPTSASALSPTDSQSHPATTHNACPTSNSGRAARSLCSGPTTSAPATPTPPLPDFVASHQFHGPPPQVLPLPMYRTTDSVFADQLRISAVAGDGNCLFRALLRAHGHDDSSHLQLRHACITHILEQWETHTHALNAVHHGTPAFSITNNESFPTPAHYSAYFSTPGTFGTEFEAFVCAKLLQSPLLIWSATTGVPLHPLYNYSHTAPPNTQRILHLSYNGIHYDALTTVDAATSIQLTQHVVRSTSTQSASVPSAPAPPAATTSCSASAPSVPSSTLDPPPESPSPTCSRRRRLTHATYTTLSVCSAPWYRRRRLTQSTYCPVPAPHALPHTRPASLSIPHAPPQATDACRSIGSDVLSRPIPHAPPSQALQSPSISPSSEGTLSPSHPLAATHLAPRRSLRIRSRTELHWGTTGHRTKRRRLNFSTTWD